MQNLSKKKFKTSDYPVLDEQLQNFCKALIKIPYDKKIPGCIFIRDYEKLPVQSSFDVDILMPIDDWDEFIQIVKRLCQEHKLLPIFKKSEHNFIFLVFSLDVDEKRRHWLHFEVHSQLCFNETLVITSDNIKTDQDSALPIPDVKWRFFLYLMQGLRKNKLTTYHDKMIALFDKDRTSIIKLIKRYTNLSESDIQDILKNPIEVVSWQKKIPLLVPTPKLEDKVLLSRRRKLSEFIFRKLFFLHLHSPTFYTIHGPDGVGKTTVINEVMRILDNYPLNFSTFHYVTIWKNKLKEKNLELHSTRESIEGKGIPFHLRILKWGWKYTPPYFKKIYSVFMGDYLYASNVNAILANYYYSGSIMLVDRYLYDNFVKHSFKSDTTKIHNLIHYFTCKVIRPPEISIILRDSSNNIYQRKQELTLDKIDSYQTLILKLCKKLKLEIQIVDVNDRQPDEIAAEIAEMILRDLDKRLFHFMGKQFLSQ